MRRYLAAVAVSGFVLALVELVVLGLVIWRIGVAWTLALVLVKGVVGYFLVRRQGGRGWQRFRAALDAGRPPGREVTDGMVGLVAALLIMVSGFMSVLPGVAGLVPAVRRRVAALVEDRVERRLSPAVAGDVFGPRRVRVRRRRRGAAEPAAEPGGPVSGPVSGPAAGPAGGPPAGSPKAIEGEILPPA